MITKKQNIEFGLVLTLVALIFAFCGHKQTLHAISIISLLLTILCPILFTPFAFIWFRLSTFAEHFFSNIFLGLIFYLIVTPIGFLRKCFAKDPMHLSSFHKDSQSVFTIKNHEYEKTDLENQY